MLKYTKNVTLTGQCMIDDVQVEGYSATINSENPDDMTLSSYQIDKDLAKKNRRTCREDRAAFEDLAYTVQDEMLAGQEE